MADNIAKLLPLTESTAYIMLALAAPLHGYGIMKQVTILSEETVKVGAGTLYGTLTNLEKREIITKAGEEGRRKLYVLTPFGKDVLNEHIRRTEILVRNGRI